MKLFNNADELQYCFDCKKDNLGTLTWMCLGGEQKILKTTGIEKCMDCGGKNFKSKMRLRNEI